MGKRKPLYLLVTGGRTFADNRMVKRALTVINSNCRANNLVLVIVHGNAPGADKLCATWAKDNESPRFAIPANWLLYGKGAGSIRNQVMLDWLPIEKCLAFPGASGTADMVARCLAADVTVIHADKVNWV